VASPRLDDVVNEWLSCDRALVVAAAGCGKTELLARTVAHPRAGRQLILTHTHAGVAALKARLQRYHVDTSRFRLDTIAGWSLTYAAAVPSISRVFEVTESAPDWDTIYPGAGRVVLSGMGKRVVAASYDGVLVDEYQDCSAAQHEVIAGLASVVPVRVVGDPLQAIFGFRREDPLVDWNVVRSFFEPLSELTEPFRWKTGNRTLGEWLAEARGELLATGRLTIDRAAPVEWAEWSTDLEIEACRTHPERRDVVGIKRASNPNGYVRSSCRSVAVRLGGLYQMVEAFDDRDLPRMVDLWTTESGGLIVSSLHAFVRERMTRVGPELEDLVNAVRQGRSTKRFRLHLDHRDRLEALAQDPSPETALAVVEGFGKERGWIVYRPEGIYQLRAALRDSLGRGLEHLPGAVGAVRTRARHRGRRVPERTLGTTLLLKGLEFDHVMVLHGDEFSRNELYVAITRGTRSLRILSEGREIQTRE
jgi:DNA helicase-2/ATP-dependent DNA helicase PcrA